MNNINRILISKLGAIFILLTNCICLNAQQKINPTSIKDKMQWFADAKLGIFIHTGIYAVDGIDESWSFHNKKLVMPIT